MNNTIFRFRGLFGVQVEVQQSAALLLAIMAGLMPILWAHGTGSEVMSRIAVPMIGGMVSSTILTLVVIPAVYALIKGRGLAKAGDLANGGAVVKPMGQSLV